MTSDERVLEITEWLKDSVDNPLGISNETLQRTKQELENGTSSGEAWLLLGILAKLVENDFDTELMRECFEKASHDKEHREAALEELGYTEYVYGDAPLIAIGHFESAMSRGFRVGSAVGIAKCCIELNWQYLFKCVIRDLDLRQYAAEASELRQEMLLEWPEYDERLFS